MKTALLLLIAFLSFGLYAQTNPYESLGIEVEVLTLSKGKYQEFHDLDSIQQIAGVIFNINTKEVIGFIEESNLPENFYLAPEAASRFISIDPLADEYSNITPYGYVANNPIKFIDPDGRQISSIFEQGAGKDGRDLLTITITGKILNASKNNVDLQKALKDIGSIVESSFSGEDIDGVDISVNFDFSIAESMDDVSEDDHLIVLAEPTEENTNVPGAANMSGGRVATVDADYFTGVYDKYLGEEGERTAAHEVGHLFGLSHNQNSLNLMSQGRAEFRGNRLNKKQKKFIMAVLEGNMVTKVNRGPNRTQHGLPNLGAARRFFRLTSR